MEPQIIILCVALVLWAAGWFVVGRDGPSGRLQPTADGAPGGRILPVSIIIPARNEEYNLPVLLRSINAQSVRPAEVIVVDDGSTDRTAAVARELGARVVASQPLPEGWRGKTWACHQGAQAATSNQLLFLDADTWFEPDGLRKILAHAITTFEPVSRLQQHPSPYPLPQGEREPASANAPASTLRCGGENKGLGDSLAPSQTPGKKSHTDAPAGHTVGAFSVGPYHGVREPYEQLSLFFNLNMTAGTVPGGLFGQMLLVDRASYRRVGGHEAVKGRIMENFWLGGQFRALGIPVRSVTGRGMLSFRMYPNGLQELIEGWTKGFASGAGQTPPAKLAGLVAWMTGLMLTAVLLPFTTWAWALHVLCAAQVA